MRMQPKSWRIYAPKLVFSLAAWVQRLTLANYVSLSIRIGRHIHSTTEYIVGRIRKTPITVTSRLEELIEDLAAKKDSFEIKYLEAMSEKLKLESQNLKLQSEKRKLEHWIQDLTVLLCKHDISTAAANSFSLTDSEVSDDSDC